MVRNWLVVCFIAVLSGCGSEPEQPLSEITVESIKTIDPAILSVRIDPQADGRVGVWLEYKKDPFTGGAQDWNSLSIKGKQFLQQILPSGNVSNLTLEAISPENSNISWAQIRYETDKLGSDWSQMTYHQLFSRGEAIPGTLDAARWLCDYYKSYETAQPATGLPSTCISG